jgi:phage portal protein BeeE
VGLFSRFKKKPKAENSLSTSQSVFWGGSTSGTLVNELTAMQTAAVYSCVRVISEAVASLPLHVYRYENNGTVMTPEHHLYNLLHHAPNPEMTSLPSILSQSRRNRRSFWKRASSRLMKSPGYFVFHHT